MLRKLAAVFILLPLGVILVMFAVANREVVTVSFDPFSSADPAFSLRAPLFALILAVMIAGVIVGGVAAWLGQGKWRRTTRKLDADIVALQREIEMLTTRLDTNVPAPATKSASRDRISYAPPAT
ncbi:MAG: lipopolysaccharide assembly protein LapA domain-containing protein [Pseudorhodoplanes sp.]